MPRITRVRNCINRIGEEIFFEFLISSDPPLDRALGGIESSA